jgi:hypothetical protein
MLGIEQGPNGNTHDLMVNQIMHQQPQLPSLTPDQFVPFLMSQGCPVRYGAGRTPDSAHPVQVACMCGAIAIPANITVGEARELARQIVAVCDQVDSETVIDMPEPASPYPPESAA